MLIRDEQNDLPRLSSPDTTDYQSPNKDEAHAQALAFTFRQFAYPPQEITSAKGN